MGEWHKKVGAERKPWEIQIRSQKSNWHVSTGVVTAMLKKTEQFNKYKAEMLVSRCVNQVDLQL